MCLSISRRNNNFHDILKGLVGLKQKKQLSTFDLTLQFHHLFWFGDLNYRVDLAAEVCLSVVECPSVLVWFSDIGDH